MGRVNTWLRQLEMQEQTLVSILALVPGFGCGDRALTLTSRWLRVRVTARRVPASG